MKVLQAVELFTMSWDHTAIQKSSSHREHKWLNEDMVLMYLPWMLPQTAGIDQKTNG